jgi:hypothetical protein
MERKGSASEVGPIEGLLPETFERLAHLFEQLPEQRIVGGVVDGEVEGKVFRAGRALGEMHSLRLIQLFFYCLEVV